MPSERVGKATLDVEITHIDLQGIWLLRMTKSSFWLLNDFLGFEKQPSVRFTMFKS